MAVLLEEPMGIGQPAWRWPDHPGVGTFFFHVAAQAPQRQRPLLTQLLSRLGQAVARACGRYSASFWKLSGPSTQRWRGRFSFGLNIGCAHIRL